MAWRIIHFSTHRGDYPIATFVASLDKATTKKVVRVIDILELYGPLAPLPFNKSINSTIGELRTTGKVPIRILYGKHERDLVLVHIFIKKTNKLPLKDLELAQKRFKNHLLNS